MSIVYFDESGHTGCDLVNQEQKTFVIASMCTSPKEASYLKKHFFRSIKSEELKFSQIRKRPSQLDAAVDFFLSLVDSNHTCLKIAIAHKEYVGIGKISDFIVENFFYENGLDFYQNGRNIAFTNALYLLSSRIGETHNLVKMFSSFYKKRTDSSFEDLKKYIMQLSSKDNLIKKFTDEIIHSLNFLGKSYFDDFPKDGLEIHTTMVLTILDSWSKQLEKKFNIIYDTSKSISKNKNVLMELSGKKTTKGIYGRDRRTMRLPLKINKMVEADSKNHIGIQLCDIIAGLIRLATDENASPLVENKVMTAKLFPAFNKCHCFPLWPQQFVTPEGLGTVGETHNDLIQALNDAYSRTLDDQQQN